MPSKVSSRLRAPAVAGVVAAAVVAAVGVAHADTTAAASHVVADGATADRASAGAVAVGPATLSLSVGARRTTARTNVPAAAHLAAPHGEGVAGATVTFWMTPPARPSVHIAAARAVTDASGDAVVRLRMTVTERITATATYATRTLASGEQLVGATVTAGQASTVTVVVPTAVRVLALAAALRGRPYVWGAAGPRSFDCSGFTMYVFRHAAGRSIPHNADRQYHVVHRVPRRAVRPGDLVFYLSGGHAYHVAIYAGHGMVWHAPHPGARVRLASISASRWAAGRLV